MSLSSDHRPGRRGFPFLMVAGLGALFCGIGLLVTGPLYSVSIALLFHECYEPTSSPFARKPTPGSGFPDF